MGYSGQDTGLIAQSIFCASCSVLSVCLAGASIWLEKYYARGRSSAAHDAGPVRAPPRTFPWYGRRLALIIGVMSLWWAVDPTGRFGYAPGPTYELLPHAIFFFDWVCFSIGCWYHTRAVYAQIRRPFPRAITHLFQLIPGLTVGVQFVAVAVGYALDRRLYLAIADLAFIVAGVLYLGALAVIVLSLRRSIEAFIASVGGSKQPVIGTAGLALAAAARGRDSQTKPGAGGSADTPVSPTASQARVLDASAAGGAVAMAVRHNTSTTSVAVAVPQSPKPGGGGSAKVAPAPAAEGGATVSGFTIETTHYRVAVRTLMILLGIAMPIGLVVCVIRLTTVMPQLIDPVERDKPFAASVPADWPFERQLNNALAYVLLGLILWFTWPLSTAKPNAATAAAGGAVPASELRAGAGGYRKGKKPSKLVTNGRAGDRDREREMSSLNKQKPGTPSARDRDARDRNAPLRIAVTIDVSARRTTGAAAAGATAIAPAAPPTPASAAPRSPTAAGAASSP